MGSPLSYCFADVDVCVTTVISFQQAKRVADCGRRKHRQFC